MFKEFLSQPESLASGWFHVCCCKQEALLHKCGGKWRLMPRAEVAGPRGVRPGVAPLGHRPHAATRADGCGIKLLREEVAPGLLGCVPGFQRETPFKSSSEILSYKAPTSMFGQFLPGEV